MNLHQQIDSKQRLLPVGHLSFRLFHYISIVVTALALQFGFLQEAFAVDVTTDTTTIATDTTTVVDEQTLLKSAQSLFSMSMQNDANGLVIEINGLIPTQIDKIFFDGVDVSELVSSLVAQGIAKVTETENSYIINVTTSPQIEGEHTLTVSITEGTSLSKKVLLTKYEANKGVSRIDPMAGSSWYSAASIKKPGDWVSSTLSKAFTITYYNSSNPGQNYTVKVRSDGSGYYQASCDSPYIKARSTIRDTGRCYDLVDRAYCTYVDDLGGVYQSGVVNLRRLLGTSYCSTMLKISFIRDFALRDLQNN